MFKAVAYDWLGANELLFHAINHGLPAGWEPWVRLGSALGNYWAAPFVVLVLLACSRQVHDTRRAALLRQQALTFACAFGLAFVLTAALKLALDFPRPGMALGTAAQLRTVEEATRGFPSGHSVYAMLLLCAGWRLSAALGRLALVLLVLWVGYSRVALGAHFPADVLWAWPLACASHAAARQGLLIAPAKAARHLAWRRTVPAQKSSGDSR